MNSKVGTKTYFKILILEDDLQTLSVIMTTLAQTEDEFGVELATVQLSEYTQVEYLNTKDAQFDVIILDHDCKLAGSFHVLDIAKFGPGAIIAISTQPEYNQKALDRGVTEVVRKDYIDLDKFSHELTMAVERILSLKTVEGAKE